MTSSHAAPSVDAPVTEIGAAPVSAARLRRTTAVYSAMVICGIMLAAIAPSDHWRKFGVGLFYPGAGFIASGGWWVILTPTVVILFIVSLIAWFGAGFTTLPVAVWLAAAVGSAFAGTSVWEPGVYVAAALLMVAIGAGALIRRRGARKSEALRERRLDYLPRALERSESVGHHATDIGDEQLELTPEHLASLRYIIDRTSQSPGSYTGFDKIDQFQTASLRYQINYLGYALAVAHTHYTPNLHAYSTEAQRQLIETYLDRQVWGYWALENAWGNLRLSADPVGKDNIMLTGFYGLQVGLYTANTGDNRYLKPGSLTFSGKRGRSYSHSLHDVADSLVTNFAKAPFGLYPCEPNWTYTACNFRGMAALQVYDRITGSSHFQDHSDLFRHRLETEFVNRDFSMVALKSKHTGVNLPFPLPDGVPAVYLNSIYPDIAARYWAILRTEGFADDGGTLKPVFPKGAVDMGNYKPGYGLVLESLYGAAKEFGDHEAAESALTALRQVCSPQTADSGAFSYGTVSNAVNACITLDSMLHRNFWQDTVLRPTSKSVLTGPIVSEVPYPHVMVARAVSNGDDLELVLHSASADDAVRQLGLSRLRPGTTYRDTHSDTVVTSDRAGNAVLSVKVGNRTAVHLRPE